MRNWSIENNIWLSTAHTPGKVNVLADNEPRNTHIGTEWALNQRVYCDSIAKLGVNPNIDLFSSRLNYKVKPFVAYQPDPEAFAIDAFSLSWESYILYVFPPFSLVASFFSSSENSGGGGHRTHFSTQVANSTMVADTNENSYSKSPETASEKGADISAKPTRLNSSAAPKASIASVMYSGTIRK